MKITRILCVLLTSAASLMAWAADYCVHPTAAVPFSYYDSSFTPGVNCFKTLAEAIAAAPAGSRIYVTPGTYDENVTVTRDNIQLIGAARHSDGRGTARPSAESNIVNTINIKASGCSVIGFRFTGNGRIMAIAGTTDAPMKGLNIKYNLVEASTVARTTTTPVFRVGSFYSKENAALAENNCRNTSVSVNHNVFKGDASHTACYILLCNLFGSNEIIDNTFTDGGQPIRIDNTRGTLDIRHNTFKNIGVKGRVTDSTEGEMCIALRYLGLAGTTTVNVCDNTFTNCQGCAPGFDMVRLHQGATASPMTAVKTRVNFNYNIIKGKTSTAEGSEYNYALFGDAGTASVLCDVRFNRFDHSEMCMGVIATPWNSNPERYFASMTGYFNFASSSIQSKDYLKFGDGSTKVQSYVCPNSRVAQNFDIDNATGDVYFVTTEVGASGKVPPLTVSRVYKNSSGTLSRQTMSLVNASHGSTLSVARFNNKVWLIISGASEYTDHCVPLTSCFLRFVSGATADLSAGKTSFSKDGTSYEIKQFSNQWGRRNANPSIDVDNRLFAEMTNGSSRRFAVYDLDDVFQNVNDAKVIKYVQIAEGAAKFQSDNSAYASIVQVDKGFHTWPHQGFTICGDYIYELEGVGKSADGHFVYNGANVASVMNHCHNWREDTHVYRKPMLPSEITSSTNGEPEGIHLRRGGAGRTCMQIGFVNTITAGSKWAANILNYIPLHNQGAGATYPMPSVTISPNEASLAFDTADDNASLVGKAVTDNNYGRMHAVISGPDADCFTVVPKKTDGFSTSHTFTVKFTPSKVKRDYSAKIRYTAPGAKDVTIPVTGKYTGNLTGVDNISADAPLDLPVTYYDLQGRPVANPSHGIFIRRNPDGTTNKLRL